MNSTKKPLERIKTGVKNLDEVLNGGIPKRSLVIFGGTPGAGKTILSQQIGFHNASENFPVIFFQTLSEPTAKTIGFASQFEYFDQEKVGKSVHFIDLGDLVRSQGIEQAVAQFTDSIKKIKPGMVIVDSFKAFDDLAKSSEEIRKFSYEVAVKLMAWECTSLLLGEFGPHEINSSPLSSVVDGIVILSQEEESGENQRFIQITKMRGTTHIRDRQPLAISEKGISIYAPQVSIKLDPKPTGIDTKETFLKTGIKSFDELLADGIPYGSSCLISGASGTGKSLMSLELLYRGAKELKEKGILFSFSDSKKGILSTAKKMGWDVEGEMKKGMIEIVHIPQLDIHVEEHLLLIQDMIKAFEAKRVVIDSISAFFYKVSDPKIVRGKMNQLSILVQNAGAVGFFITDVPYGSDKLSHFGVEETVVDGIILLSADRYEQKRERAIEIYKLKNSTYRSGRHILEVTNNGLRIVNSEVKS